MNVNNVFLDLLPKIDLHGFDRDGAKVATNDFIDECFLMGYERIVIIHGIGMGVVKNSVHDVLSRNKKVLSFHLVGDNIGCTVVELVRR